MIKEVTRDWLVEKNACASGLVYYNKLNQTDTEAIIRSCMKDGEWSYASWLMARVLDRKGRIAWSVFAAEQVIDIYEKRYPNNTVPRNAIQAAKAVLKNDTPENRKLAKTADAAAAAAAYAAYAAAVYAARAAVYAARAAAYAYAADAAAAAAADAADAAAAAAAYAAYVVAACAAAADAAREEMRTRIMEYGIKLIKGEV